MDSRTAPTKTTMMTLAAASPNDRPELHNSDVDEVVAETGACAQVHLQSGRTCTLEHRHQGSCDFVARQNVSESVADHRAAEGW
jgi:hypothetical protein